MFGNDTVPLFTPPLRNFLPIFNHRFLTLHFFKFWCGLGLGGLQFLSSCSANYFWLLFKLD